jgi:acyl-CoA synthetase (AMP-forming)/AMP-acid ligase II
MNSLKHGTIIDLLRWRAINQPDRDAYTFLADGEHEEGNLSYTDLDYQARKIGGLLQKHAAAGSRVLLLYPAGLEFVAAFFGTLYAGMIPIPAPQPHPNKTLARLQTIAEDASASLVLVTLSTMAVAEKLFATIPELRNLRWLVTDGLDDGFADEFQAISPKSDGIAVLQYTSGSTSLPKGVKVTHENIMRNSAEIDMLLNHADDSVFVNWLPHFHDMGLFYGLIQPLYTGFPAYLMPPVYFLQRPVRWLEAISRHRGTHSAAPSFAYDLCVRKISPNQCHNLDLKSWKMAGNAAEPISAQAIERFTQTFEPFGFRRKTFTPCYGLAESTLIATGVPQTEEPVFCTIQAAALAQNRVVEVSAPDHNSRTVVSCGRPAPTAEIAIVDPASLRRSQDNEIGEIWIRGESVAQGYWNRSEESAQTFGARLSDSGEGPYLRTGDLGFIKNGGLYVTGRLKDLIIIAGHNHYPQDIEETVEQSHPSLRRHSCAAFSIEDGDQEALVVVAEVEPHYQPASGPAEATAGAPGKRQRIDPAEIRKVIRRATAEAHELPVRAIELIKAGTMPKTTSGKIQRRECKRLFLNHTLEKWGE